MNIFLNNFQSFISLISSLENGITNPLFSVLLQLCSFSILLHILMNLLNLYITKENSSIHKELNHKHSQLFFFIMPIVAIMFENLAWIFKIGLPKVAITRIVMCTAWILSFFKFHSLAIFLEKLTKQKTTLTLYHRILFACEIILSGCSIFATGYLITYNKSIFYINYFHIPALILWFASIIPSIIIILKNLTNDTVPIVLKKQLKTFLTYLITPYLAFTFLEYLPTIVYQQSKQNILFSSFTVILITLSFYFCYKQIMQFRFLNLSKYVKAKPQINISTTFKDSIEQLSTCENIKELEILTQNFLHEQHGIDKKRVSLHTRNKINKQDSLEKKVEAFFNNEQLSFDPIEYALSHKLFIKHEIEFDAFYTTNSIVKEFLQFLQNINCAVLIPILQNKQLTGYVIIQEESNQKLYSFEEQNKMIIFAQFVSPAIHMIMQKNMYHLMQESKEIKEELYAKHQEVNQYKESIKKLLKDRVENHIGIIFYKNKHFSFRNKEAQELIGINPNFQHMHPTAATLTNLAQQVEKFKTTQNMCISIQDGNKLMVSAMPYTEPSGGVILTVRHPEPTDIIRLQLDALKDPSKRDYLLYLETTQAGKLINTLLPSNNETLLNIKIKLLEVALQKNALLLQAHDHDAKNIVTIIHDISLKERMHILTLDGKQTEELAVKLFGINSLLQETAEEALLDQLNNGTLVIKNIEHLDLVTQQKLAYFIRYGIFTPVKSEQRKFSNARIICSTNQDLKDLVAEKKITQKLYEQLEKSTVMVPCINSLEQSDLSDLVDGFMYQTMQNKKQAAVTPLNIKEKTILLEKNMSSFYELKERTQSLMTIKAKEQNIKEEKVSGKSTDAICPEFELASQLGKHALKDVKLMTILWKKIGSQTKIADLLGVNRSSVNRRCKDYNLV